MYRVYGFFGRCRGCRFLLGSEGAGLGWIWIGPGVALCWTSFWPGKAKSAELDQDYSSVDAAVGCKLPFWVRTFLVQTVMGFVFDKVTSVWSKPAARPAPLFMSQSWSQKRASKNEVVVVSDLDSLEEDDYLEEDVEAEYDEHN